MARLMVSKLEVAKRQIDTAIRMIFSDADPVVVHTIAAAGNQIVRDICQKRGDIAHYSEFVGLINPSGEKKFWALFNRTASFLKHANHDPHGVYEFEEEETDFLIGLSIRWYKDLGNHPTAEMTSYFVWWNLMYPDLISAEGLAVFDDAKMGDTYRALKAAMSNLDREQQRKAGAVLLGLVPSRFDTR